MLIGAIGLAGTASASATPDVATKGRDSAMWVASTLAQKTAYIDGLCAGYERDRESRVKYLSCTLSGSATPPENRFCGVHREALRDAALRDPDGGQMSALVRVVDDFYADAAHSHLDVWMATAAYDDRQCGEDKVTSSLPMYEAVARCYSRPPADELAQVSKEARAAQRSMCIKQATSSWRHRTELSPSEP